MTFIEEVNKMKNDRENKENEVINEIVEYFREKINSEKYETFLKNKIEQKINESKDELILYVEFWEYKPGCSETNFKCDCYRFELKSGKYEYKDIVLKNIQYKVGILLSELLKDKLKELGLQIIDEQREDYTSRFNYYENKITIGW